MTGHLEDELAIRALVARYADAVNRRAVADLAALFTEDGVWDVGGYGRPTGREEIAAFFDQLLSAHEQLVQLVHSGTVEVDGPDTAAGRWYLSEVSHGTDGTSRMFAGSYDDRVVRTSSEGWRFARRSYTSLFRGLLGGRA